MIVDRKNMPSKISIDLNGPQGNAFCLLGMAKNLGKQLGMDAEEVAEIQTKMKSSDYENLVAVFDEAFGEHVILYR